MRRLVRAMFVLIAGAVFADTLHAAIEIRSDYPGGNVKVLGIDETNGVVRVAPDLRDTEGKWFHFDFTVRGAAGRTLRFQFPQDKYEYLSSLGPAISRDGGATWTWLNADGTRYKPINYAFASDESETRFALSIPYTQKNWDAASVRWRGKDGVEFGVLCKSQSGKRDTEMLRIRCRKEAKWLFAFTARHWVQDRPNCWLSVCCEFGYSLCGGVYSQDGGRELGHNLLKAVVRTARP